MTTCVCVADVLYAKKVGNERRFKKVEDGTNALFKQKIAKNAKLNLKSLKCQNNDFKNEFKNKI